MLTHTDDLIRLAVEVIDDPDRGDPEKLSLVRAQLTLVIARRRAARTGRSMARGVAEWAESLPDGGPRDERDAAGEGRRREAADCINECRSRPR